VEPTTTYCEYRPNSRFAGTVECFWTLSACRDNSQIVLPDGCCDLLLSTTCARGHQALVIGAMTKPRAAAISAGDWLMGVRFRPGSASPWFPCPTSELTDRVVPLHEVWGTRADELLDAISPAAPIAKNVASWERILGQPPALTDLQRTIARMVAQPAEVTLSRLADRAYVCDRHFRRLCLNQTGLTPKKLARVLRFRQALARARSLPDIDMPQLAVDCGYFDQSHMIHDFNEFAGQSPSRYLGPAAA